MNGMGSKFAVIRNRHSEVLAEYDIHEKNILMERVVFFLILSTIVTAAVCLVPDTSVKGFVPLIAIFELMWFLEWRHDDDYSPAFALEKDVKHCLAVLGVIVVMNLLIRAVFSDVPWYLNLALALMPFTFAAAFWPPDLKVKSFMEYARARWPNGFLSVDGGGGLICLSCESETEVVAEVVPQEENEVD